jgi:hypothetical protein
MQLDCMTDRTMEEEEGTMEKGGTYGRYRELLIM